MKTEEKQLKEFVDEAVQEYNSCLRPGENRVRLRLTNREVLVMDTAVNRFIASKPKDQPTELIKTVNPVGFLKNGKYFSFEQMQGETNDASDVIQPLYSMALHVKKDQPKGGEFPSDEEIKEFNWIIEQLSGVINCHFNGEMCNDCRSVLIRIMTTLKKYEVAILTPPLPKAETKFEICLWVHTDIDEPDTTFTMVGKNKEEIQENIDYINKNCLKSDRRLEIMEEVKS